MSTPPCAKWLALTAIFLSLAVPAGATPLKSPKRVVSEQTVDLTPLFRWWTNHAGARPLTAWVHVTGTIVATNSYGWVVDAHVEASKRENSEGGTENANAGGNKRILLLHPPLQDRTAFEQLAAQLKDLSLQHTQAANVETQARQQLHSHTNHVGRVDAKAHTWERQDLTVVEQNAAAVKKQLDHQIQDTKAKLAAWPSTDHYEVDCFALDTGKDMNRVPLYDHGISFR